MKTKHLLALTCLLPLGLTAHTPEPTSALQYQQTTNTRIVVEENYLRFFTGGSERMTVDANGNVGVGLTTFDWGTSLDKLVVDKGILVVGSSSSAYTYAIADQLSSWQFRSIMNGGEETLTFQSNFGGVKDLMTFDNQTRVGIGTDSPQVKLHIQNDGEFGIRSSNADVIIEAKDAHLDLISDPDATWGSAINFIEGNGNSNTDIWSITRQTTAGDGNSSLRFNYGTDNTHINNNKLTLNADGKVGIGTENPDVFFHVSPGNTGDAILRLEADKDNAGAENDNARIELYQDGKLIYAHLGFNEDVATSATFFSLLLVAQTGLFVMH